MELKRINKGFNTEFRNFRAPAPFLIGQAAFPVYSAPGQDLCYSCLMALWALAGYI